MQRFYSVCNRLDAILILNLQVTKIVHLILDTFVDNLKTNSWMDEQTKRKAVEKARNILLVVGYPEWYKNTGFIETMYSQVTTKT